MIGVICDAVAILIGGLIGFLAKKMIPENWNDAILKGLGLCSVYIGISGALAGENSLILIMAIVFGAMIGEGLKIEQRFDRFSKRVEERLDRKGGSSNFAQGFMTSSLMMCVGAMVVVGSLNAGLSGDLDLLFTKTAFDGIGAVMFASSMGVGVIFSCVPVFIIEGGIVMLAGFLAPLLTDQVINEMTCAGSVLIAAMGFNLVAGSKLRIMNYMPGVFLPIIICPVYNYISGLF